MTLIQEGEVAVIDFAVTFLTNNGTQLEADLGPLEIQIVNAGVKIADAWFNKLPMGLGGLLNGLLEGYAGKLPGDINQYVGQGIALLIAYLKALAAHISAS